MRKILILYIKYCIEFIISEKMCDLVSCRRRAPYDSTNLNCVVVKISKNIYLLHFIHLILIDENADCRCLL